MGKRFIDSHIWSDEWFLELEPLYKLVYIYVFSNCDISGLYKYSHRKLEFDIGKPLKIEQLKSALSKKIVFSELSWLIKNFIKIQYPKILACPNAPLHVSVFNQIEKNGLLLDLNSLSIDYRYSIDRVQVEVKVKEEVKVKAKAKEEVNEESEIISPLEDSIQAFKEHRRNIKKPLTDKAEELLFLKLEKLAPNDPEKQIQILEQSILNGWQGVFPLDDDKIPAVKNQFGPKPVSKEFLENLNNMRFEP